VTWKEGSESDPESTGSRNFDQSKIGLIKKMKKNQKNYKK